jgi:hypothetical protein
VHGAILDVPGVVESRGIFSDADAFWVNGKQIGEWRSEDSIELRVTKAQIAARRADFKSDPRVEMRKGSSDWITVRFARAGDVEFVAELAEVAAAAHRAPDGATPKPPPVGADLERRRRFH